MGPLSRRQSQALRVAQDRPDLASVQEAITEGTADPLRVLPSDAVSILAHGGVGAKAAAAIGSKPYNGLQPPGVVDDGQEKHDRHLEALIEQLLCPQQNLWQQQQVAQQAADGSMSVPADVLDNLQQLPADDLARLVANYARAGQFSAALVLLEEAVAVGRYDAVRQIGQKIFLQAAGAAGNVRAVLRFLHSFPPEFTTAKTYNLALSACQSAKSLQAASKIIDIMAIRQFPCDFIHFTTLITGKVAAVLVCSLVIFNSLDRTVGK
eukprot:gene10102-10258_t